ncbi:hypothetical protein FRB95_014814 [Tulasnella sp. JGI-2019a]|nr:hypothetical protein FRB95_014814 [Tulasnella sp. JGI-2019a]
MASTHRALAVPELFISIFGSSTGKDLNNLALVCSSWKELALDIKWRTSTVPLTIFLSRMAQFYCEDLNTFCEPLSEDEVLDISDEDWSNFQHYAQKVTRIRVDLALLFESVAMIKRKTATTNQKLCPNLVYLEFENLDIEDVDESDDVDGTITILAGPELRTLSVTGDRDVDEEMIRRLDLITGISPHITTIVGTPQPDYFPEYTIFKALRQLRIQGYAWGRVWKIISDCLLLEMLEIEDWKGFSMDGEEQREDGQTDFFFPKLELLSVKTIRWNEADPAQLISASSMPRLQSLKLTVQRQTAYVQLLQQLRKTSPLLHSLHVETRGFDFDPSVHVGDILNFVAIRKLVLETNFFNDAMLEQIGNSLPELRELHIGIPPTKPSTCGTNVTTWGLISVSMYCRSLERLSISVTDSPISRGRTPSDLKDRAHKLQRLRFYHVRIEDETSEGFADWLATFCPNVCALEVDCLSLGCHPSISKEEIDRFVEGVFKARQTQTLEPISLSTGIHPSAQSTLGNTPSDEPKVLPPGCT